MSLEDQTTWTECHARLSGIGEGSAEVNWQINVPIGITGFCAAQFTTQILEGCGTGVPALLGLEPMQKLNSVLDLRDLSITVDNPSKERCRLQCYSVSGHLMLPIDWGGVPCNMSKQTFVNDPLGISAWFGTDGDNKISANKPPDKKDMPELSSGYDPRRINGKPRPMSPYFQQKFAKELQDMSNSAASDNLSSGYDPRRITGKPTLMFPYFQKKFAHILQPENLSSPPADGTDCNAALERPSSGTSTQPAFPTVLPSTGQIISSSKENFQICEPAAVVNDNSVGGNNLTGNQMSNSTFFTFVTRTHAFMSKIARREKLMTNSTYRKKYQPLPANSPIPSVYVEPGKWMFWELWAGTGKLTKAFQRLGLATGPPITKELGWDLSLPKHQEELMRLYHIHQPEIVFAAPTCGPWSRSNTTMQSDIKDLIREEQVEAFKFFTEIVRLQHEKK
jgi:hypothetical protein